MPGSPSLVLFKLPQLASTLRSLRCARATTEADSVGKGGNSVPQHHCSLTMDKIVKANDGCPVVIGSIAYLPVGIGGSTCPALCLALAETGLSNA